MVAFGDFCPERIWEKVSTLYATFEIDKSAIIVYKLFTGWWLKLIFPINTFWIKFPKDAIVLNGMGFVSNAF